MTKAFKVIEKAIIYKRNNITCLFFPFTLKWSFFHDEQEIINTPTEIEIILPKAVKNTVQIIVTTKCNLSCDYCSVINKSRIYDKHSLDEKDLKNVFDLFCHLDEHKLLIFTGGEPLLKIKQLIKLSANFRGNKILFTNGLLLSEKNIQLLREASISIIISLDGTTLDAMQYRIGSNKKLFNKIFDNIKRMKNEEIPFGVSMVISTSNYSNIIKDIEKLRTEFNVTSFGINMPHYVNEGINPVIIDNNYVQLFSNLATYSITNGVYIDQIARKLKNLLMGHFRFRDCSGQGSKIVFYPGSKISNCINQMNDNLEIWNNKVPLFNQECRTCEAIGICGGGCIYDSQFFSNKQGFERRHCKIIRELIPTILWKLYDIEGENASNKKYLIEKYHSIIDHSIAEISNKETKFSVGH